MAVTQEQIAALYVAAFQRAPAKNELDAWYEAEKDKDMNQAAADIVYAAYQVVNNDVSLAEYYPAYTKLKDVTTDISILEEFVASIYKTLFGKGLDEDKEGIDGWVSKIIQDGGTFEALGKTVAGIVYVADEIAAGNIEADETTIKYAKAFENRKKVALESGEKVPSNDLNGDGKPDIVPFQELILKVTDSEESVKNAEDVIEDLAKKAQTIPDKKLVKIDGSSTNVVGDKEDDYYDATTEDIIKKINLINDPSTEDNDLLRVTITGGEVDTLIMNVENIQISAKYNDFSVDASKLNGVKELDLSSKIGGKKVTVDKIDGEKVAKVVVDASIGTATINSSEDGTKKTVEIEDNAKELVINGGSGATDQYEVNVGNDKTVEIGSDLDDSGDTVSLNLVGNPTITTSGNPVDTLVVNSGEESYEIKVGSKVASTIEAKGKELTIDATDAAALNGVKVKKGDDTTVNAKIDWADTGGEIDLKEAAISKISIVKNAVAASSTLSLKNVESGTEISIDKAQSGAVTVDGKDFKVELNNNVDGGLTLKSKKAEVQLNKDVDLSTLTIDSSESGVTLDSEGGKVETLTTTATDGSKVSVVVKGDKDLTIGSLDLKGGTLSTDNYFQNLTVTNSTAATIITGYGDDQVTNSKVDGITVDTGTGNDNVKFDLDKNDLTGDSTINTGSGNDTVTVITDGKTVKEATLTIDTGDGNDIIDTSKIELDAKNGGKINIDSGSGNDAITTASATTINAGEGDDTVQVNGTVGEVTLGDGKDTLKIGDSATVDVKDFTTAEDHLVWLKNIATDFDLNGERDLVTNGKPEYDENNDKSDFGGVTLEKVKEDWSQFSQLGTKDKYVLVQGKDIKVVNTPNTDFVTVAPGKDGKTNFLITHDSKIDYIQLAGGADGNDTTKALSAANDNFVIKLEADKILVGDDKEKTNENAETADDGKHEKITETDQKVTSLTDLDAIVNAIGALKSIYENDDDGNSTSGTLLKKGDDALIVLTGSEVKVAGNSMDPDTILVYVHASKDYNADEKLLTQDITPIGVIVDQTSKTDKTGGVLTDANFDVFQIS